MKLIIELDETIYNALNRVAHYLIPNSDTLEGKAYHAIANGTPYNPTGDCISREALKKEIVKLCEHINANNGITVPTLAFTRIIDNAQPVDIKDQIAGAYNEGYMCGNKEAEKARPQGEYVGISKLRLMTVEECAGHTIEYAMGWKACIEWIKKGGAE